MQYPYIEISSRYDELFREFVTHYVDSNVSKEYANQIKSLAGIPEDVTVELGGKLTHKDVFGKEVQGWTEVCVTFPLNHKGGIIGQDYDIGIAFDNKTGEITNVKLGVCVGRGHNDHENILRVFEVINQIKNLKETEELKAILEKIETETRDDVSF